MKKKKELTFGLAAIILTLVVGVIIIGKMVFNAPVDGMFFLSFIIVICAGIALGYSADEIETEGFNFVRKGMQPFFIVLAVGGMVSTWMAAGTITSLIYYGLKIISPQLFLITSLLLCSITSLATGTSWGTMATAGVALMSVGQGLGIPAPLTAGCIICGSYFGDKMSPFSDTTNLAAAVTNTKLMTHVKHMMYEQVPTYIITAIIFIFIGFKYKSANLDMGNIDLILNTISSNFKIGFIAFLPAVLVIVLLAKRVSPFLSLMLASVAGGIVAIFYQGQSLASILKFFYKGFSTDTGVQFVNVLVNRGGVTSMFGVGILMFFALFVSGVLNHIGVMDTFLKPLITKIKSVKSLTVATMIVVYFGNGVGGSASLAAVLAGTFMGPLYKKFRLKSENLSRVIESCGTYGGVLMPWNGHAIYAAGTLGVATVAYLPYCFMNYISPIVTLIYGFTGFSMKKYDDDEILENELELNA
ncbi:malate-2H(+)/Na(+)-lactate antiporter [Clostridium homopropionicum DSM 5847]|uniref:Malate-2H(+)/Na(+)-lactate antiporter n=1 Tax=Clostridium homopropionicum DSM 5847 TaxID=1121318 RepID=A0A0L6ZCX4_9CLOT|nr:Na+/H+ antiporter NhaC [Clostridium homopropionicum]KOA20821.1 malate-2H(+)/Na(+)-lactate antiporter [Clostridium homopropionicum DSM 5847]SFF88283.1 transporter, NhaC family [Clostridium homopropionicum]